MSRNLPILSDTNPKLLCILHYNIITVLVQEYFTSYIRSWVIFAHQTAVCILPISNWSVGKVSVSTTHWCLKLSVWRQTLYDITDKNNNVNCQFWRSRRKRDTSDNVCLDLQNCRYSIYFHYNLTIKLLNKAKQRLISCEWTMKDRCYTNPLNYSKTNKKKLNPDDTFTFFLHFIFFFLLFCLYTFCLHVFFLTVFFRSFFLCLVKSIYNMFYIVELHLYKIYRHGRDFYKDWHQRTCCRFILTKSQVQICDLK